MVEPTLAPDSPFVQVSTHDFPPPGTENTDTLYYDSTRKLKWADFTGKARHSSSSAALSFTGFSYDAASEEKKGLIQVNISLQIYFVKTGSWVKEGQTTGYALRHEQIHFDISKLAAEKFRSQVQTGKFSAEYYGFEINQLFFDNWRQMNLMQERFDDETAHGVNHAEEARWEKQISHQLRTYTPRDP